VEILMFLLIKEYLSLVLNQKGTPYDLLPVNKYPHCQHPQIFEVNSQKVLILWVCFRGFFDYPGVKINSVSLVKTSLIKFVYLGSILI